MTLVSFQPLTAKARRIRWGIIGVTVSPLVGSYIHNLGWRIPLPGCLIRHFTGIPCPTCGMTRAFIALAQGKIEASLSYHFFGSFLFTTCLLTFIHSLTENLLYRRISTPYTRLVFSTRFGILFVIIYMGYYVYRIYQWVQFGSFYGIGLD